MKAPAVAIDVHHALTPELRERIIDDIRTRIQEPSYRLLSPEQLRELARLDTGGPPLVSLYLQLTPERRVGRAWHSAFSALAHQISHLLDKKERAAVEADLGQIERALSDQLPVLGRGVVFFVCRERGIWRQIALPIPLPDQVRFASRPYLRPLLRGWGRHDRMLIALLSRQQSRFFTTHLGNIEEIYRVKGQRIRGMLTDRVPRDRRDAVATQVLKDEAKALASMAEMISHEFETSHILLSAPPDMSAAFCDHLSRASLDRVAPFEVSIHASPAEIAAAAAPVQQQVRKRAERQVVDRLCEAAPGAVSTGTQETLDCLRDGRVLSLVADDSYAARGMHCRQCRGLFEPPQIAACPRCGSAELEPVDDLVEAALQQALDQKAAVTFIRDPDCRKAFTAMTPLRAWLRY
jgi:peptide chain release factor subunit 1